jgi:hypothetical protein
MTTNIAIILWREEIIKNFKLGITLSLIQKKALFLSMAHGNERIRRCVSPI